MVALGCCSASGGVWMGHAWTLLCNLCFTVVNTNLVSGKFAPCRLEFIGEWYFPEIYDYPLCAWGCLLGSCSLGFHEKVEPLVHETKNTYAGTCDEARLQKGLNVGDLITSQLSCQHVCPLRRDVEYQVMGGCEWILNPACADPKPFCILYADLNQHVWTMHARAFLGLGMATWSDEDYIGRISRTARKVHPLRVAHSTIKRCLVTYRKEWQKVIPAQRL